MIRNSLIAVIVLSLTACATLTGKDDLPVSDLLILEANVKKDARPILLPNGKHFCLEDAATEDAQDDCAGDLEDALYQANLTLERVARTVQAFITGERARRNPCSWWQFRCRARR